MFRLVVPKEAMEEKRIGVFWLLEAVIESSCYNCVGNSTELS